MALDPAPLDLVVAQGAIQALPEVLILDRLAIGRLPAIALPARQPLGDPLAQVLGIGDHPHRHRPLEGLQGLDNGHQFHAVIGGMGLAATELLFVGAKAQQRSPAPRTRIALTGPIAEDLDRICHESRHPLR